MPEYPIRCECGYTGDVFAKVADCGNLTCPKCGNRAEQDWGRKLSTVAMDPIEFFGDRAWSRTEGFHSNNVAEARREMGESGRCIDDKGDVWFKDRAEQRRYMDDKANWELRKRDKLAKEQSVNPATKS